MVILASSAGSYIVVKEEQSRVRLAANRVRQGSASPADIADARKYFGHLQAIAAHNLMMCFGRSRDEMTSQRVNREAAEAYKRGGNAYPQSATDWLNAMEYLLHEQHEVLEANW